MLREERGQDAHQKAKKQIKDIIVPWNFQNCVFSARETLLPSRCRQSFLPSRLPTPSAGDASLVKLDPGAFPVFRGQRGIYPTAQVQYFYRTLLSSHESTGAPPPIYKILSIRQRQIKILLLHTVKKYFWLIMFEDLTTARALCLFTGYTNTSLLRND